MTDAPGAGPGGLDVVELDLDAVDEELLLEDMARHDEDDLSDENLVTLIGDEADAPADTGRPPAASEVSQ